MRFSTATILACFLATCVMALPLYDNPVVGRTDVGSGDAGDTSTIAGPLAGRQSVATGDTGDTGTINGPLAGRQSVGSGNTGNTGTGTLGRRQEDSPLAGRQSVGTGNTGNTGTGTLGRRQEVGCNDSGDGGSVDGVGATTPPTGICARAVNDVAQL